MLMTKGRGVATGIPEMDLIKEIKKRPLLYDKQSLNYRKPGAAENAWSEVADNLNTSVSNCKKRWKSLRDTFIKYFRIEQQNKNDNNAKRKRWHFYNHLKFLEAHVELFRFDLKSDETKDAPIYVKEHYLESDKHYFFAEECSGDGIRYQIKIADDNDYDAESENQLIERIENYVEDTVTEDPIEGNHDKICENKGDESTNFVLLESSTENEVQKQPKKLDFPSENVTDHQRTDLIDPDEQYLLSCLPAFKRFTSQQKALARIGIEKLFYEIEFENSGEPASKKMKS